MSGGLLSSLLWRCTTGGNSSRWRVESQGALWCMGTGGDLWLVGNSKIISNGKDLLMGFTGVVKILHGDYRYTLSGVCENPL